MVPFKVCEAIKGRVPASSFLRAQIINGLNPDDIVDLRSCIEKYDLAMFCDTWLKETIGYTIKINGETTCKCFNKPRLVQTRKLKGLL